MYAIIRRPPLVAEPGVEFTKKESDVKKVLAERVKKTPSAIQVYKLPYKWRRPAPERLEVIARLTSVRGAEETATGVLITLIQKNSIEVTCL